MHWMLLYAVLLHAIWGIFLLWSPDDIGATPLALLHIFLRNRTFESAIYLLASLGTVAMLSHWIPRHWSLLCGLPQQFLLMVSAGGSLWAVIIGQYADGVPRPWVFILADQLPAMLAALCHTGALLVFHGGLSWPRR